MTFACPIFFSAIVFSNNPGPVKRPSVASGSDRNYALCRAKCIVPGRGRDAGCPAPPARIRT
jgi:hypothetical protein